MELSKKQSGILRNNNEPGVRATGDVRQYALPIWCVLEETIVYPRTLLTSPEHVIGTINPIETIWSAEALLRQRKQSLRTPD